MTANRSGGCVEWMLLFFFFEGGAFNELSFLPPSGGRGGGGGSTEAREEVRTDGASGQGRLLRGAFACAKPGVSRLSSSNSH